MQNSFCLAICKISVALTINNGYLVSKWKLADKKFAFSKILRISNLPIKRDRTNFCSKS